MRKYLSGMATLVCLSLITGCASVDKAKCDKAEKAEKAEECKKAEKAVCPKAEKEKQEKNAADLDKRKVQAEKLMTVLKTGEMVSRTFEMVKKNQMAMMGRQLKGKQLQNAEEANKAVMDLMTKELSWEKLKGPFINIYAESFTAEELDALINFYESDIGKKLVDKQPEIQKSSMDVMRGIMMELLPKVSKLSKEIIEKQEKAASAAKAAAPAPAAPAAAVKVAPAVPVAAPAPAPVPAAPVAAPAPAPVPAAPVAAPAPAPVPAK